MAKTISEKFKVGDRFPTKHNSYIKIMAIADGYIMARYKGCVPFCLSMNGFIKRLAENAA